MDLLGALEAEKLTKQKWKQYCGTPCTCTLSGGGDERGVGSGQTWEAGSSYVCLLSVYLKFPPPRTFPSCPSIRDYGIYFARA